MITYQEWQEQRLNEDFGSIIKAGWIAILAGALSFNSARGEPGIKGDIPSAHAKKENTQSIPLTVTSKKTDVKLAPKNQEANELYNRLQTHDLHPTYLCLHSPFYPHVQ